MARCAFVILAMGILGTLGCARQETASFATDGEPLIFHGLDLRSVPSTTSHAELPDLFEPRAPRSGHYQLRHEVVQTYHGPDGTMYYVPSKDKTFIQHDAVGSEPVTYYGPIDGDYMDFIAIPERDTKSR